jgi:hypothetical protein
MTDLVTGGLRSRGDLRRVPKFLISNAGFPTPIFNVDTHAAATARPQTRGLAAMEWVRGSHRYRFSF